jgi:5-formyltetrahydrofolate cyclo-ligase
LANELDLLEAKRALRGRMISARAANPSAATDQEKILAALAALPEVAAARTVALYAGFGAEFDPSTLASRLPGKVVAWPRVRARRTLDFACCAAEELVPGTRLGGIPLREPPPSAALASLASGDVVVVPGVAFDETCQRLGYGGGYYDAALGHFPAGVIRVGAAFELQIAPAVPVGPGDQPVDILVTERRVVRRR